MQLPHFLFLLAAAASASAAQAQGGSAVIELFTSEGCSSCPPAERLISSLLSERSAGFAAPIVVVYSVDYWNHLGWIDPYSDRRHSVRQERYAELGVGSIFTPALIINGSTTVVGSDVVAVREALTAAAANPLRIEMDLTADWQGETLTGTLAINRPTADLTYLVALVQDGIKQPITRGENQGRTLHHDRLCRALVTMPSPGRWILPLPDHADRSASRVVALAQQHATGRILGASQVACE